MSLWLAMVCPRNRVELVIVVGMDSQDTANLISLGSMLATVAAAIYTRRQAIGSKEAKAKADEAHKAALDMRDAAQRSVTVAEEQANQAERSAKAAEEQVHHAEELLEQMSDIASSLRRPILELVHENKNHPDHERYRLRNSIGHPVTILEVMNLQEFFVRYCDIPELPAEVHRGNPVNFSLPHDVTVKSLELRIKVSGKEETLFVEIPR